MEPYRSYFPHAGLLLPVTERQSARVFSLPTGTSVGPAQIARVCEILATAVEHAKELTEVRENGWAVESGESAPGEASLAAPIRSYGGLVVGAIGISGAADRLLGARGKPEPALLGYVRDAARAVSRDLGAGR